MILMFPVASLSLYPADHVALGVISFRDTDNLSSNSGSSVDPAIAASGDNVYVAWSDKTPGNAEIIFRASTDRGETFTAKSKGRLSNTDSASITPRVASNGDSVYVVWVERGGSAKTDIYLRASHNSGASFEKSKTSVTPAQRQSHRLRQLAIICISHGAIPCQAIVMYTSFQVAMAEKALTIR
jgi:hypothetical protein